MGEFRNMLEAVEKHGISEALKVVKKNWKLELPGWKIEINDKLDHSLLDRIAERTNLKSNQFSEKMRKGLEYVSKKNIKKTVMIGLYFKKSNFTILYLVNPKDKFIRISSVLDSSMDVVNSIKWELNEFNSIHGTELKFSLNEAGPALDYSVFVEPWKDVIEVYYFASECETIDL